MTFWFTLFSFTHGQLVFLISLINWLGTSQLNQWYFNIRKLVIDVWHKVCTPNSEGCIGRKSLRDINEVAYSKLGEKLLTSNH
jgi:hypothetical protein